MEKFPRISDLVSLESLLTATLATVSIVYYLNLLRRWKHRRPPLPPGPRGLPLLGNLPFLDPELHSGFAQLARIYGPILSIRLGTKLAVVVTSPSLAKEILRDHDIVFANRDVPASVLVLGYGGRDIVWTPYGPEWRMLRKVCVREMLGNASLDAVYGLRRREMRGTVADVYSKAGSRVTVGERAFFMIMNVITGMLWGGTLKAEERSSIGSKFRQVVGEITELLGKPDVSDLFPGLARFDVQRVQRRMKALFLKFDRLFDTIIYQKLKMDKGEVEEVEGEKERIDFLQFMLNLIKEEEDSKTPFTMDHLRALLMDMVVGGTDTASNTIEWAIAHMMDKLEVMKKVQDELERVVGRDNIVEESHISKLHYLDAVVKEVLRLHPALPLLVPHCPSQSCTIGGYTIPEGARVFLNVWAIHRDPSIWPNPSKFDPERFTQPKAKWDYSGNDFHYFPFGSGRRICAGIAMAERMVMYALASLVHSFDWTLPPGEKLDLSEKFGIVLKKATPLVAVPTPRLSNSELYQ
ncbi:cytochrome P450 71AU50-like [Aristolochia californica]|uniref:cytochrome P450 71AU50-like n=1 Tax=Aristolochia californica TaxID=171875 RepID=UPI0035DB2993